MSKNVTVLVVETNYLIASAIESPLAEAGFKVVVAVTDDEVVTALNNERIHVSVIDYRLQHGGPEGLVSRLHKAGIPYIFCTSASTQEVVEHFPNARVVEKPFGDDLLLSLVAELVELQSHSEMRPVDALQNV